MPDIPCYLTIYNLVTWPRAMAAECDRLGLRVVLLDNGSTWPECRAWLDDDCEYEVIDVGYNAGCYGFFNAHRHYSIDAGFYVVSDSDLDLTEVPDDAVVRLIDAFGWNEDYTKIGLSLEVNDIDPAWPFYSKVKYFEASMFEEPLPGGCTVGGVGATLALYHTDRNNQTDRAFYKAARLDRPYTARHLPWYLDLDNLDAEQRYFFEKCDNVAYYGSNIKQYLKRKETPADG